MRTPATRALRQLGLGHSREACASLFDRLDDDGSGTLAYVELDKTLQRAIAERQAALAQSGG